MENYDKLQENPQQILKMIFGTYEGKVYNMDYLVKSKKLSNNFSFKASENSLKVISNHDNFIFASGVDEIVHIYDINKKVDHGMVVTYSGSISNIVIAKEYLIASGEEKTISLWRMKDFQLIHTLKGHKKSIIHLAVQSKGAFLISVSKDNSMIIWDLSTGRKIFRYIFQNNLVCNKILMFRKDKNAILIFDLQIWIFDIMANSENPEEWVTKKINCDKKIIDAYYLKKSLIVFHSDGHMKIFFNIENSSSFAECEIEVPTRIKEDDLEIRIKLLNCAKGKKLSLLTVVFTNNEIDLFDLNRILSTVKAKKEDKSVIYFKKYKQIKVQIPDRITCVNTQLVPTE